MTKPATAPFVADHPRGAYSHIRVNPLTPAIGAEIEGVDLATDLSDAAFAEIERALTENLVLFFRDQPMTPEQHLAFGRRFGELDIHPAAPSAIGYPELMIVAADEHSSRANGEAWHTDVSCNAEPPMGSILHIRTSPPVGGDTLFANMYAAYDALSAGMQSLISGLCGIHTQQRRHVSADWQAESSRLNPPVAHPLVRIHPETGRKALYVGEPVKRIEGLSDAESAPILEVLMAAAIRPQGGYRHQWQVNDLVFWDNRCTNHQALGDYDSAERRRMERTTLVGEPSGHLASGA